MDFDIMQLFARTNPLIVLRLDNWNIFSQLAWGDYQMVSRWDDFVYVISNRCGMIFREQTGSTACRKNVPVIL